MYQGFHLLHTVPETSWTRFPFSVGRLPPACLFLSRAVSVLDPDPGSEFSSGQNATKGTESAPKHPPPQT